MPPTVALESSVIAQGLPPPANLETALAVEAEVASHGGVPKTIGLIDGAPIVGLTEAQLRHLAIAGAVEKISLRNLPVAGRPNADVDAGATTVAATIHLAHLADISVTATGGIGGVHRSVAPEPAWDVSADLEALRRIPSTVVCSGPKVILDLTATREVLESYGVSVVGYQTDVMPAFYCSSSGLPVDVRCDTPEGVAEVVRARDRFDLDGAILVTVPPPNDNALPRDEIEPLIDEALSDAAERGITDAAVTPFLLKRLRRLSGANLIDANQALLTRNARVATQIAVAVAD